MNNQTNLTADEMPAMEELDYEELVALYDDSMRHLEEGEIVTGYVVEITDSDVVVDVGYKSEGLISLSEFMGRDGEITVKEGEAISLL